MYICRNVMPLHPVALLKMNSFTGSFQRISWDYQNTYFSEHAPGCCCGYAIKRADGVKGVLNEHLKDVFQFL